MPKVSFTNSAERMGRREPSKPEHSVFKQSWSVDGRQPHEKHAADVSQRRVLVVDSDRGAADNLGFLVSESGGVAMVAYGYPRAVEIAERFRPDLVLVDLSAAASHGCPIVARLRAPHKGRCTKIVALAGHGHARSSAAMNAGFDMVLPRPISQAMIIEMLMSLPESNLDVTDSCPADENGCSESNALNNCESAFCDKVLKFQQDIFKTRRKGVRTKLVNDILIIRMPSASTGDADIQDSSLPDQAELPNRPRRLRREVTYPVLEMLVQTVFGVRVRFMDYDICESTGEEIIVIALSESPAGNSRSVTGTSRKPRFHKERRRMTDGFECDEESAADLWTDSSFTGEKSLWTLEAES